ncbi:MAG: PAS domain-containing protein, partial [Caulobacteraceae bacterium]
MHPASDEPNRAQLRQIIAGLTDGVILIEPDSRIVWANEAALAMHGVDHVADLGGSVEGYHKLFRLKYRNGRDVPPDSYPAARLCRGEDFTDLLIDVSSRRNPDVDWVHRVRGFTLNDREGWADCLVLVV